ncbi:methyltransferase domain-containing protein [Roseovarius sp.]|uniref:methyltransferase domain-containing protein n=1 Tax=Roseovarius sp. TaxID=1486281 RepID=UPI0025E2E258|nr:methyltransferase domain-containing protein [Roseovarius sp.]
MTGKSGFQLRQGGPEVYERCWVRAQLAQSAEELVAAANVSSGDRVIDIACGTGVVARSAAVRSGDAATVTGADVNSDMLAAAARFAADADLADIAWVECDAADIPEQDSKFDVALCQQGLQFMPDKKGALAEMWRVLKPGGRLAITVWKTRSPIGAAFANVFDRHFGEGTAAPWEMVYSLGDRARLRKLASGAGFRNTHITFDVKFARHPDPAAFISGAIAGSPMAEVIAGLSDADHDRLIREILAELSLYHDDDGLAVPAECLTLTALK